jgi:AhpD family alkylhydroperoxidase
MATKQMDAEQATECVFCAAFHGKSLMRLAVMFAGEKVTSTQILALGKS